MHDDFVVPGNYPGPNFYDLTVKGMNARETVEVTFWSIVGLAMVFCIGVPVAIGVGTRLWTWALS